MREKAHTAPLSLVEKMGYGAGDMASNFYMGVINVYLLYYYTGVWGLDPADAAFMFLITKIVDAVSDPAMGLISDRTSSRWGRYRPYLLWVAVPLGLLGYVLFLGPDLSSNGKLIFAYASYTMVMLAYTAVNVPYSALLAVIHPKAEERTKATQYRFIFASLGTLVVGATTKPLVDYLGGGDEVHGFRLAMILFSMVSIVLFWFTFVVTRERIQPAKQESNVKEEIGVLVKNVSWIALAISGICVVIGLVARISSTAFYGKYYLAVGDEKYLWWMDGTTLIITAGFLGQLVGALLTPTLLRVLEKKTLMVWTNFGCAASIIATYILEPHQYGLTLVMHTLGIFAFGIIITLLFAMYTDCAEYGEWVSGKNSAGLTVSASMFSLKAGSAIGSAIPAALLAMYGFDKDVATQSSEAIEGIQIMYNVLPAVFFVAAGVIMLWYKIDRALLKRIEEELSLKRAQSQSM